MKMKQARILSSNERAPDDAREESEDLVVVPGQHNVHARTWVHCHDTVLRHLTSGVTDGSGAAFYPGCGSAPEPPVNLKLRLKLR